jgi:DNA polymerase-3 subunit alpha
MLSGSDGKQEVVIYLEEERAVKRLPKNRCVALSVDLLESLKKAYGEEQIKVVDKKR